MPDARDISSAWACPACRYDMTGAPTPICPECGIDAVAEHARLQRVLDARRLRRITWPPEVLLVLAFLYALTIPDTRSETFLASGEALFPPIFGTWLLATVWLWYRRREVLVRTRLAWTLPYVALLVLSGWCALSSSWRWDARYDLRSMTAILCIGAVITTGVWLCTKGRSWRALLLIFGLVVTTPGAVLAVASSTDVATANEWSPFSDPRPGQIHHQYPLRWDEVRTFAPRIVLAGLALLIASLVPRKRATSAHCQIAP